MSEQMSEPESPENSVGEPPGETLEKRVQRATDVQARYADVLMNKPHVVGVAVGYCTRAGERTQDIGVIVMVERKVPQDQLTPEEIIPRELDGVPVDVQETGVFSAG
jgi:hypothetical protein